MDNSDVKYIAPYVVIEEKAGSIQNVLISPLFDESLKKIVIFNNPEQIIEKINDTVSRVSFFCSKYVGIDEFTGIRYDVDCDDDATFEDLDNRPMGYLKCNKI